MGNGWSLQTESLGVRNWEITFQFNQSGFCNEKGYPRPTERGFPKKPAAVFTLTMKRAASLLAEDPKRMKVGNLRSSLEAKGLPTAGTRAELVERLESAPEAVPPPALKYQRQASLSLPQTGDSGSGDFGIPGALYRGRSGRGVPDDMSKEVRVRLNVYDILCVDVPNHSFTVDFFIEVSWEEDEPVDEASIQDSIWEPQFPYKRGVSGGKHLRWTPRLQFENCKELRDRDDWIVVFDKSEDGSTFLEKPVVCYRLSATGVFKERFELQSFPIDSQDLQISILSMCNV